MTIAHQTAGRQAEPKSMNCDQKKISGYVSASGARIRKKRISSSEKEQTHLVKNPEAATHSSCEDAAPKSAGRRSKDDLLRTKIRTKAASRARKAPPPQNEAPQNEAAEKARAIGAALPVARTSDLLRGVLTKNPEAESFTLETIMRAIGEERFDANLLFISLPTLELTPDKPAGAEVSAALLAGQMAAGRRKISLPQTLWEKEIPRHSLAVAIHAALPVIEAAEKLARPRFKWLTHPVSRRILGAFLFLLTATVAFPFIGFDPLHSLSTFAISFGLAEGDGAAILLGMAMGVIALGLFAASNCSLRALRSKAASWLRNQGLKFAGSALARLCERLGLNRVAAVLRFDWRRIVLFWRPEGAAVRRPARRAASRIPQTLELVPIS